MLLGIGETKPDQTVWFRIMHFFVIFNIKEFHKLKATITISVIIFQFVCATILLFLFLNWNAKIFCNIYCLKWTYILCGVSFPLYIFINVTDLCTFIYCVLASELNKNNEIVTREKKHTNLSLFLTNLETICTMAFDCHCVIVAFS